MSLPPPRALVAVALLVVGVGGAWAATKDATELVQPAPALESSVPDVASGFRTERRVVSAGATAGSLLRALDAGSAQDILTGAKGALDRLSIGDTLAMDWRDGEKAPWRLRLLHGSAQFVSIERAGTTWTASSVAVPYAIEDGVQALVVEQGSSLWAAADAAGLDEAQIGALAKIYEYDIDFNTEIQPGAIIRAVAEKLVGDDGSVRFGDIRAAEFVNGKKTYTAIRHVLSDGTVGWFAPEGEGRRRPFLRSPLAFSRVTSGFTHARYHPLLGVARPHLGVDYGAPTGTPVRAVADGVVGSAGWSGGFGNHVQVGHDGPYSTSYSHLSAIKVKRGEHVRQGDIIGLVGSTGMSTGPHLHYQFMVNGRFVNPVTVDLPMTGALPEGEKPAFFATRDAVLPLLASARGLEVRGQDAVADAGDTATEKR